jgi:hypothetical protein
MYMMSLPFEIIQGLPLGRCSFSAAPKNKKADVAEDPEVFDHVGLFFNEPPGRSGLFFI